jgi:hypothetical protein
MSSRLLAVVLSAVVLAGCAGRSASTTVTQPAASDSTASSPPAVIVAPTTQRFGGWDDEFGAWAFRISLTTSATGSVTGRIVFVAPHHGRVSRIVTAVAGKVGAARRSGRRSLHLLASRGLSGVRTLHGSVGPNHLLLSSPDSSRHELDLYGSAFDVGARFRNHVRALRGPGGFYGWLRRAAESRAAVHHLDIDGDGRKDLVTVVWSHLRNASDGQGTREVTVHFANGSLRALAVPTANTSFGAVARIGWIGSLHLPGIPGRQIVLVSDIGAANRFYSVIGDVGGELRQIPAAGPDGGWGDGGAVGTGSIGRYCNAGMLTTWFTREIVRHARLLKRQHVVLSRYVWQGNGWERLAHVNAELGRRASARAFHHDSHAGLWNCH